MVDYREPEMHAFTVDVWSQATGCIHDQSALTAIDDECELHDDETTHDHGASNFLHQIKGSFHSCIFI